MLKESKKTIECEIAEINEEFGLEEINGDVYTTSLNVAETYGKEHKNVMAKIKHFLEVIPELAELSFKLGYYLDPNNQERPMYYIDRKGFAMLVNKFTGDKALIFTAKYTDAFERMIELITQLQQDNNDLYDVAV